MDWREKKRQLENRMEELCTQDICMAFSGGVDSSLLLHLAAEASKRNHTTVYAVTFDTQLHPAVDLEIARDMAEEWGVNHEVISLDEFENPKILMNPPDRCYLCKRMLFGRLLDFAGNRGVDIAVEGSNADDQKVYRPGLQAVRELGILSPLTECNYTKEEVRRMAAERGMQVSNRPSTPCLATRLPYGTRIQREVLDKIERGEADLRRRGYYNVRMRVHGDLVRLEVDERDFHRLLDEKSKIVECLHEMGFHYITLDLQGFRSGSMDEHRELL